MEGTIEALAPTLSHLHGRACAVGVHLSYNLYLSNPPTPLPPPPDSMPDGTTLSPYRPEIAQLVRAALPTAQSDAEGTPSSTGGGLLVVASGPEGIVLEARNAVACLGVNERVAAGGVGFHGEQYAL